jgi:hypothetical protein
MVWDIWIWTRVKGRNKPLNLNMMSGRNPPKELKSKQ